MTVYKPSEKSKVSKKDIDRLQNKLEKEIIKNKENEIRLDDLEKRVSTAEERLGIEKKTQNSISVKTHRNKIAYSWEPPDAYALGVDALRNAGENPLNVKQNLEARMKNKKLFDTCLGSCTAIHYRGDNMFKIIMDSPDLLNIPKNFNEPCMIVDYKKTKGIELDMRKGIYHKDLTKKQFLAHEAWYISFGGKFHEDGHRDAKVVKKMEKYAEEFYDKQGHKIGMAYPLRNNPAAGELRSLELDYGCYGSFASGEGSLNGKCSFVRRTLK